MCAATGRMMHMVNALKEPKNAIIEENSGIAIDTPTERQAVVARMMQLTANSVLLSAGSPNL
jgi:hypothetical protein